MVSHIFKKTTNKHLPTLDREKLTQKLGTNRGAEIPY